MKIARLLCRSSHVRKGAGRDAVRREGVMNRFRWNTQDRPVVCIRCPAGRVGFVFQGSRQWLGRSSGGRAIDLMGQCPAQVSW
jgi:hypothetical protein